MPLREMPNGEYVDVPDNVTPDGLKRIEAQFKATRQQNVAAGKPRVSAEQAEVNRRADARERVRVPGDDFKRSVMDGITFGTMDRINGGVSALTSGVYNAITKGDINEIGKEYTASRDTERELSRRAASRSPWQTGGGELVGAVLNPVGTGAKGLQVAAKGAEAVGLTRAANALSRTGTKIASSGAVPQAVMAGGVQGALNAAGHTDDISEIPSGLLEGGALGALTGGAVGGVTQLGARGVQILRDALPANAERNAYARIAQLLESGKTTPRKIQREIAVTDARGGDAMVQDVLPSLRAQAGAISRKPTVSGSNDLIERGEQRIQDRRARFGERVREDAAMPAGGDDALARGDALAASRKADGQAGYAEGGVMDTPITSTPALQSYLKEAPEEVQGAMRGAYREMLLRDQKPAEFVGADGIFTHIPNLRTFDYVKRSFDQQIGQALRSGDKATAQGLSYQLDKLKGVLADANPADKEYKALLGSQRDAFQKQNALEIGQSVLSRMTKEPRLVLRDLKALPDHAVDDARVGVIDALINADNKADPVAYFRTLMRNNNQRKVMEFAFGGKGNLGRFERWVNREVRSTRADVLTAPGRQSETARFSMAADDGAENTGNVLSNAMRGFAFGGTVGAASGVMRTLQNIATGTSRVTQEEIAKILLSKGENLASGVSNAKAFTAARAARNTARARTAAKAGQQMYTNEVGAN